MAYVNSTRVASNGLVERFTGWVKAGKAYLAQRQVYVQTLQQLNQLTDRELSDLGLHRIMIADVAREAAYGKQAAD